MKYIPKYQQPTGGLPTYKGKPTTADKIGNYLKRSSQYIAESLPQFGMNIPFDVLRDLGVKVPVTMISPTGYQGSYGTNQTTKQFAKHLVNNAGEAAAIDMGFGVLGKGIQTVNPVISKFIGQQYSKYATRNIPTFRKMPVTIENGRVFLTNNSTKNRSTSHFTFDQPVQSHSNGNWDDQLYTIVTPWKHIRNKGKIMSIEPSDVIITGRNINLPVKKIQIISGDPTLGSSVKRLTTPKLDELFHNIKIARESYVAPVPTPGINLNKVYDAGKPFFKDYASEVRNIAMQNYKQPTLSQFKALEKSTGLKAGVIEGNGQDLIKNAINTYQRRFKGEDIPEPTFPNGRQIEFSFAKEKMLKDQDQIENLKGLIYDPTSHIDYKLKKANLYNQVVK